jgi:acetate CoA/acetoacetate CoA-transferase beta subunit
MNHCDKHGNSKIVKECTLPLTSRECVDLIITELAVFQVTDEGLILTEIFAQGNLEDIVNKTQCEFTISEKLREIPY